MTVTTLENTGKNPPVARLRVGGVNGAIWKRTSEKGTFYNATFEIRYKDGETWKSSESYGLMDLLALQEATRQAYAAIDELQHAEKAASNQREG